MTIKTAFLILCMASCSFGDSNLNSEVVKHSEIQTPDLIIQEVEALLIEATDNNLTVDQSAMFFLRKFPFCSLSCLLWQGSSASLGEGVLIIKDDEQWRFVGKGDKVYLFPKEPCILFVHEGIVEQNASSDKLYKLYFVNFGSYALLFSTNEKHFYLIE